jgi:ribosomal protein S18 acetylase RimI-like enzyme
MTLGVIDEFRSTGLAKKLLNQVVIFSRDKPTIGIIFLHVVSYNRRAIKFYKNNGFSLL